MDRREILDEIDVTLDQIIENAETLKGIQEDPKYATEVEALKKTQESLLARQMKTSFPSRKRTKKQTKASSLSK